MILKPKSPTGFLGAVGLNWVQGLDLNQSPKMR